MCVHECACVYMSVHECACVCMSRVSYRGGGGGEGGEIPPLREISPLPFTIGNFF